MHFYRKILSSFQAHYVIAYILKKTALVLAMKNWSEIIGWFKWLFVHFAKLVDQITPYHKHSQKKNLEHSLLTVKNWSSSWSDLMAQWQHHFTSRLLCCACPHEHINTHMCVCWFLINFFIFFIFQRDKST